MRCEHCGGELVEVDNPMRREFRHRRGVVCSGMPRPPAVVHAPGSTAETSSTGVSEPEDSAQASERPCHRCEGGGQIASDEDGSPWTFWAELEPPQDFAVRNGWIFPIPCPECSAPSTEEGQADER